MAKQRQNLHQIAQQTFGYDRLRPAQQEVIKAVLEGRDTLAVMPTGSGKSAIYQIAALLIPGITIVISPLLALQRDQVEAIKEQNIARAAAVNSTISNSQRQEIFAELENQQIEFLFLSPEQFNNQEVVEKLVNAKPSLFVIDEAHCISKWGHDFRPDYHCLAGITVETDTFQPFPINSYVIHTSYGKGQVMRYEADKMVVLFEKFGYKTLAVELVQKLLKQVE